jgi:preprotein translocase subunit SecF
METSDAIDRLLLVREAHVALTQQDDVGGVLSAVSFLPAVPKGRGLSATASRSVIRAQLVDPESAVRNLGFVSRDDVAEVWRIGFRLPMTTQSDYGSEIEAMGQAVADALALKFAQGELKGTPNPEIVLTGGVQIAQKAQEILFRDLFTSFLSAFLVVAVVMMFLLRSIVGGVIAMIPNIFPTVSLFGYMGLTGLPLDIGSVMTASVALGIAVDDTIHLLSRFGSRRARGMSRKRAAWGALRQCSLAMVHTTLVCGLSLLVYAPSDFVPTRQFSFLMFGLLGIALVGDLLLLPALMVSRLGHALSRPVLTDAGAELENDAPIDARRLPFMKRQAHVGSKT